MKDENLIVVVVNRSPGRTRRAAAAGLLALTAARAGGDSPGCLTGTDLRPISRHHASPNVTKKVIDWEHTTEILRSDLRTRLRDQFHASPARSVLSDEGSCSQDPGAPHVQDVPPQPQASGGESDV